MPQFVPWWKNGLNIAVSPSEDSYSLPNAIPTSRSPHHLARVVPAIWHQGKIAGSFDSSLNQVLLLSTGACASGGLDFTSGADESDQHVEAFVVNFLRFELLDLFTTVVAKIRDEVASLLVKLFYLLRNMNS
jgi:hypothetical protein